MLRVGLVLPIVLIAAGYALYSASSSSYELCRSTFGMVVRSLDPNSVTQCNLYSLKHFGGIAMMAVGGIVLLASIIVLPKRKD